jgi:hypothetical protein
MEIRTASPEKSARLLEKTRRSKLHGRERRLEKTRRNEPHGR